MSTYDATNDVWIDEKQSLPEQYQEAYSSLFNKPAPQVRESGHGGFHIKGDVMQRRTASELRQIIRLFRRGGK